eukprot:3526442-Pleurochrysis_carterae.AAC.1
MLCDQLSNTNFGNSAQGRHLLAGMLSSSKQKEPICRKLANKGRRGERSLRHLQRDLGYAPASAWHTASAHPTGGGLHLPRVPYRREKLNSLPPRHQRRRLVAVQDPERHFVHPP